MRKQLSLLVSLFVVVGVLAAGCAQPPTPTPVPAPKPTTVAPTAAPAPTKAPEKVTLLVWDELTGDAEKVMVDVLTRFTKSHPNIEIKRESHPIDQTRSIISTALASGTGPDVFVYDAGPANSGVLAKAGLLLPLDEAYTKFGWDKTVYKWTNDRVATNGKKYGIPDDASFLGVYYNKDIFKQLNVEPPKTIEELEAIAEKAKAAGYTPINWANKPGWPASNVFSMLVNNALGLSKLDKVIWEKGSWDQPEVTAVVQKFFVDYQKKGYFPQGVNGIDYPAGHEVFWQGKSAMYPTGGWVMKRMTGQKFDIGFFFWPAINGTTLPPGGVESAYFVSAKSKYPAEAQELLRFLFDAEQLPDWLKMGKMPAMDLTAAAAKTEITPLQKFALELMAKAAKEGGLGYNIDVVTPAKFNDVMYTGFQAVVAGQKTAEQQVKDMQKAWEAAIAAGDVQTR